MVCVKFCCETIDETMIYINGKKQPASIDEYGFLRFQIEDVLQDLGYSLDERQDISEEDLVQHESTPDEYIGLTPHWSTFSDFDWIFKCIVEG